MPFCSCTAVYCREQDWIDQPLWASAKLDGSIQVVTSPLTKYLLHGSIQVITCPILSTDDKMLVTSRCGQVWSRNGAHDTLSAHAGLGGDQTV